LVSSVIKKRKLAKISENSDHNIDPRSNFAPESDLRLASEFFTQTCIQFNEWSKRRQTLHRFLLIVPFFAANIAYRVLAITVIVCFVGFKMAVFPILALYLTQV
jgi:hypothetical protein